jgi:hypothetical protein
MSATASALPREYESYRPKALAFQLTRGLGALGIVALPPSIPIRGLPEGRTTLINGARQVVAQIDQKEDTLHGFTRFVIYDVRGGVLFEATERIAPYPAKDPRSLRYETVINTLRDAVFKGPAFSLSVEPGYTDRYHTYGASTVTFRRYAHATSHYDWNTELVSSLEWLHGVLVNPETTFAIRIDSPRDAVYWTIASDPQLVPYLPGLRFSLVRGRVVVSGVVPSTAVYNLIVLRTLRAGFSIDPRLTIYTGLTR